MFLNDWDQRNISLGLVTIKIIHWHRPFKPSPIFYSADLVDKTLIKTNFFKGELFWLTWRAGERNVNFKYIATNFKYICRGCAADLKWLAEGVKNHNYICWLMTYLLWIFFMVCFHLLFNCMFYTINSIQ